MSAGPNSGLIRWRMLAIVCLGFFALTLNWSDCAAAFGDIGAQFHSSLSELTLLAALFFVGYGLAHVPGGMLATRIGMKRTLVIGPAIRGIAGILSGLSYHYTELTRRVLRFERTGKPIRSPGQTRRKFDSLPVRLVPALGAS